MIQPTIAPGGSSPALAPITRALLVGALAVAGLSHLLATLQPVFSDEFLVLGNFWDFVQHRTVIPGHAQYPALYSYMTAPLTGLFLAAGLWAGLPPCVYDVSEWIALRPELGMWPARLVSLVCWGVCVWAVWRIAREMLQEATAAWLAVVAFATSVGTLEYSGYGLPDAAMMMFAALAALHATRLARGEQMRRSALLAGLLGGLALATKYTALALALPLLVAGWLSRGESRARVLARLGAWAAVGFFLGCPGWIVAPTHYWRGLMLEREHMAAGHLGFWGVPLLGQLELLTVADPFVLLLAVTGTVAVLARPAERSRPDRIVLLALAGAVLLMGAAARKQSLHYLFALYPALAVLAGLVVAASSGRARERLALAVAAGLLGCAAWGLWWGYRVALLPDSLVLARQWINGHLPEGSAVAVDWIDVPRLVGEEELAALTAELRSDLVRAAYAGLRGFPTVAMQYDEAFLRSSQAECIITSSTCYARFFEFGLFTRIPPPEGTPLRAEFDRRRAFYQALFEGRYGWHIVYDLETGNGPRVLIFRRR